MRSLLARRVLVPLFVFALLGVALVFGQSYNRHTEIFQFVNGIVFGAERLSGMFRSSATGLTIGGTDVASITLTTATVSGPPHTGFLQPLVICGDDAGTTVTNYLGPSIPSWKGDGTDYSLASTACSALDSTTEATADLVVSSLALRAYGMRCISDSTQAAGESLTMTLRSAAADTAPVVSCVIGAAATECRSNVAADIAAGATMAVKVVPSGNNAAGHVWCELAMGLP